MPEGKVASKQSLENASWYNDDGFGWAIRGDGKILVGKNMNFDNAYEEFMDVRSTNKGDALFHLRITTQGATDLTNCHPFYVGKDQLSVVAHNGMLPVDVPSGDNRSDTRMFAEKLLPQRGGITFLNGDGGITKLSKWAEGSKLVFLTVNPASKWRYVIINSEDGHWGKDADDGVWFSNGSYKYTRPTYSTKLWSGWDYGHQSTYVNPYKVHKATEDTPTTTVEKQTTMSARKQELYFELQHHSYEIAESLIEMSHASSDDPLKVEMDYYNIAEELLERFAKIYSPYDVDSYQATCSVCGNTTVLNHLDLPATHCPTCDSCLYCGSVTYTKDDSFDCCGWPGGFLMTYADTVSCVEWGKDGKQVPASF